MSVTAFKAISDLSLGKHCTLRFHPPVCSRPLPLWNFEPAWNLYAENELLSLALQAIIIEFAFDHFGATTLAENTPL